MRDVDLGWGNARTRRTSMWILAASLLAGGCYSGLDGGNGGAFGDGPVAESGTPEDSGDDAASSGGSSTGGDEDPPELDPEQVDLVAAIGARRLTPSEYNATVRDLVGEVEISGESYLPAVSLTPFDNDFNQQTESAALIISAEFLAIEIAAAVTADPAKWQGVTGCVPTGPDDATCFSDFLRDFGRRALRRPLTDTEHDAWMTFLASAQDTGTFETAVGQALQMFLQHPEFLYRIEIGERVEGDEDLTRLTQFEVATRLSYFLWGTTPDDWLLDVAEDGGLSGPDDARAIASEMLESPRTRDALVRFHQMWLGYSSLPISGDLGADMLAESRALVERVVFDEQRPWSDLFRAEETFVTDALAEHYGIEAPDNAAGDWVAYGESGRRGILSHGTFLSNGSKEGDTSPTLRGLAVRARLMCQDVPPPPPEVNDSVPDADETEGGNCKEDRYSAHRTNPGCATCHVLMDDIGFGLEQYDQTGAFRTVEAEHPECGIEGRGSVEGLGEFSGPGELGLTLADTEALNRCAATQLYRFATGRSELDDVDEAFVDSLLEAGGPVDYRLDDLIVGVVSDPTFFFARQPAEEE